MHSDINVEDLPYCRKKFIFQFCLFFSKTWKKIEKFYMYSEKSMNLFEVKKAKLPD